MLNTFISDTPRAVDESALEGSESGSPVKHISESVVPVLADAIDRGEDAAREAWARTQRVARSGSDVVFGAVDSCAAHVAARPLSSIAIAAAVAAIATAAVFASRSSR
jgi:hypothetical protein